MKFQIPWEKQPERNKGYIPNKETSPFDKDMRRASLNRVLKKFQRFLDRTSTEESSPLRIANQTEAWKQAEKTLELHDESPTAEGEKHRYKGETMNKGDKDTEKVEEKKKKNRIYKEDRAREQAKPRIRKAKALEAVMDLQSNSHDQKMSAFDTFAKEVTPEDEIEVKKEIEAILHQGKVEKFREETAAELEKKENSYLISKEEMREIKQKAYTRDQKERNRVRKSAKQNKKEVIPLHTEKQDQQKAA